MGDSQGVVHETPVKKFNCQGLLAGLKGIEDVDENASVNESGHEYRFSLVSSPAQSHDYSEDGILPKNRD